MTTNDWIMVAVTIVVIVAMLAQVVITLYLRKLKKQEVWVREEIKKFCDTHGPYLFQVPIKDRAKFIDENTPNNRQLRKSLKVGWCDPAAA